ncbi:MAG: NAD-dependent epimerase/dehydratase family protein, partial [Actinobacteria bacterium]|nr:NAD-dependent epimerase/dehydratase family protein [Actinomycetota bacterium]
MKLLVLGGTVFLGRHLVEAALRRGHEVTLFNRGRTNASLFPEVERLRGDRDGHLGALENGHWDAAIDTSGYFPRVVRASAELLADRVEHYTFVSSVSVYADLSVPPDESSPVGALEDETVEEFGPEFENYGPLKALCERESARAFPGRALIVRPGLIVGPQDPTDRFTYWPRRLARGGEILAPGPPARRTQFIDVRDLAEWLVAMIERRATGVFNAVNEGVSFAELLEGDSVTWVDDEFLLAHGVGEWMELPLWIADPAFKGMEEADVSAAVAAGLRFRRVSETVRDTAEWDKGRGDYEPKAGLAPEREAELLAAWH